MLHLASNIKWIRLLKGYTQVEYGEKVGATEAMIKSYEGGKAYPNDLIKKKIARLAGVSVDDLEKANLKESSIEVINPDTKKVEFTLAPQQGANQHEKEMEHLRQLLAEKEKQIKLLTQLVEKSSKKR